jgi:hypothetical protein
VRWRQRWQAIAARIDGLVSATELFAGTVQAVDSWGIQAGVIIPELKSIQNELEAFCAAHASELPEQAVEAVHRFTGIGLDGVNPLQPNLITLVVPLAILRSEFEYLVRDQHEEARSLTELAFEHLRRSIAVDDDVRRKWREAFESGETSCEHLGGRPRAHLDTIRGAGEREGIASDRRQAGGRSLLPAHRDRSRSGLPFLRGSRSRSMVREIDCQGRIQGDPVVE